MSSTHASLPSQAPWPTRPVSRTRRNLGVVGALAPVFVVALLAWPHLGDAARGLADVIGTGAREPPLIKAPTHPFKVAASTGAADQQADGVRAMLAGGQVWEAGVDLLPSPEQPILVPASDQDGSGDEGIADPGQSTSATADAQPAAQPQSELLAGSRLRLGPPPSLVRQGGYVRPDDATGSSPARVILPAAAGREAGVPDAVYRVQIAAMPTRSAAHELWEAKRAAHTDILGDLRPVVEHVESGTHVFFRVQVGDLPTPAAAKDLCEELLRREVACVVIRR